VQSIFPAKRYICTGV